MLHSTEFYFFCFTFQVFFLASYLYISLLVCDFSMWRFSRNECPSTNWFPMSKCRIFFFQNVDSAFVMDNNLLKSIIFIWNCKNNFRHFNRTRMKRWMSFSRNVIALEQCNLNLNEQMQWICCVRKRKMKINAMKENYETDWSIDSHKHRMIECFANNVNWKRAIELLFLFFFVCFKS